ncbi:hypothetical protein GCM10022403_020680 [Streptomyces coacervatus]|uniref:Uncharacterized protein n=1 Tax=Streptomyces coacervatus TaxID=647381 RepID=A0ABP7H643_9ACTN|nr:hypothetical protein [Streptomyces coacervatus]MDF2267540.1 hypothetical protein [Streptomyces coacervatus]
MTRHAFKLTRTRIAVLLSAPVLGVGFLVPSAWADTPPPQGQKIDSSEVIDRACKHASEDAEDGGGPSCEKLIKPFLSHVIGPGSGLTCRSMSPTDIDCRPEEK